MIQGERNGLHKRERTREKKRDEGRSRNGEYGIPKRENEIVYTKEKGKERNSRGRKKIKMSRKEKQKWNPYPECPPESATCCGSG